MFSQFFVKALPGTLHLLKGAALATAATLFAVAVSSCPANAQATYNYTGNHYTSWSGPFGKSSRVTATLQLSSWLPLKASCIDVTQLPGFRLVLGDGVQTLDTAHLAASDKVSVSAFVSTDPSGQITGSWILDITDSSTSGRQAILTADTVNAPCGKSSALTEDSSELFEISPVSKSQGHIYNRPGVWSYPSPDVLIGMLLNQINLGVLPNIGKTLTSRLTQIETDVSQNNGNACGDAGKLITSLRAANGVNAAQLNFIEMTLRNVRSDLGCQ